MRYFRSVNGAFCGVFIVEHECSLCGSVSDIFVRTRVPRMFIEVEYPSVSNSCTSWSFVGPYKTSSSSQSSELCDSSNSTTG